jgi:NTP pyrophosphatase (non-canonical NTP hydrolase)
VQVTDFTTYQRESRKTSARIHCDHAITYPTLGLVNEAGEFAGKVKKIFRDKDGVISEDDRQTLKHELGDVLWYLTQLCTELGSRSRRWRRPTWPSSSTARREGPCGARVTIASARFSPYTPAR